MNNPFPSILIEGKQYPTVILGGDRFTGVFRGPRNHHLENVITTPDYISTIFDTCYRYGFRGYDVSISKYVIRSFSELKAKFPDSIGIGNLNWECRIMLGDEPLRKYQHRILAYLFKQVFSDIEINKISAICQPQQGNWFFYPYKAHPLTSYEIHSIYIDLEHYQTLLNKIKDCCDFCLVGTVFADWLPLLNREDILKDMISMIRENGLIPLSIHHWTSLVLLQLDMLDVAGHWTYINKACQVLAEQDAISSIQRSSKPITAFKALLSRNEEVIKNYFDYLFRYIKVSAVDFGIETHDEARLVSNILHKHIFYTFE